MLRAAIHRVLKIISILTHELCSALWNECVRAWKGAKRPPQRSIGLKPVKHSRNVLSAC